MHKKPEEWDNTEIQKPVGVMQYKQGGSVFKIPISEKWNLAGRTQVKFRASRTTNYILGLVFAIIVTAVVLNYRIQKLEFKNASLEQNFESVNNKFNCLMIKLSSQDPTTTNSDNKCLQFEQEYGYLINDDKSTEFKPRRVKRSPTMENQAGTASISEFLQSSPNSSPPGKNGTMPKQPLRKKERGNYTTRGTITKTIQNLNLEVNQLTKLFKRNQLAIKKLKTQLKVAKNNAKSAKSIVSAFTRNQTQSIEPKAVYLTVRDPHIDIQNPKLEHIGPWYMAETGNDLGFNDMWYQNLSLNENGTSVIFQENGLYLIYAQVYYRNSQSNKDKISPMGYKIFLKKNSKIFKRPIPIAECVPAFPKTYFQTCMTMVCWHIEQGDEIYLEHFTEATPIIEAENMGQTFLGIVRLSS